MIESPPETDQRRQNLLTQLAGILQVDTGETEDLANPRDDSAESFRTGTSAELVSPTAVGSSQPPGKVVASETAGASLAEPFQRDGEFMPLAPNEFSKLRLAEAEVESLILKFLLNCQKCDGPTKSPSRSASRSVFARSCSTP